MKTHSGNLDPIPLERTYSELRVQRESVPTQPGLGTRVGKAKIRRGGHGGKRTRVQYVRLSQASSGGWAEQKEVKGKIKQNKGICWEFQDSVRRGAMRPPYTSLPGQPNPFRARLRPLRSEAPNASWLSPRMDLRIGRRKPPSVFSCHFPRGFPLFRFICSPECSMECRH